LESLAGEPSHKVGYRNARPQDKLQAEGSPEGNKKPRQSGVGHMFALVEGHPNFDVMIFYVLAAAILAATLYRFNRKQI
jgi:hypothetical protein